MAKIEVVKAEIKYLLRLWVTTNDGEVVLFQTTAEFTKREADYRAVSLSARNGWNRDELPTHENVCAYPKKADDDRMGVEE